MNNAATYAMSEMDEQNENPQQSELVEPGSAALPVQAVPDPIANPAAPSPPADQPVKQFPAAQNDAAEIVFNGVDSSVGVYLLKFSWLIIISLVVMIATFYFTHSILGFVLPLIVLGVLKTKYENSLFATFASVNNYSYSKNGSPTSDLDGLIFSIGHSQKSTDIVSGMYKNWNFNLFVYNYTIGSGKNQEKISRAVLNVDFDTTLPAFILRRHRNLISALDNEGESLKTYGYTEKISLEGDFDQHFAVYIRPGSQDNVLSVLTPDVMQILLGLDKYEIELTSAGNFYIYAKKYIENVEALIDAYKILEAVTKPIGLYASVQKDLHSHPGPTADIVSPSISSQAPVI